MGKGERERILKQYEYLNTADILTYLWEFLRRNKAYQKWYDENIRQRPPGWGAMGIMLAEAECDQFALRHPLDYNKSGNDDFFLNKPLSEHFDLRKNHPVASFPREDSTSRYLWRENHPNAIDILVDVSASQAVVIKHVKDILKQVQEQSKLSPLDVRAKTQRWKDHLIAHDLRDRGYRTKDIALIVFPGKRHVSYGDKNYCAPECKWCKRVNRLCSAAQKLIDGQYKAHLLNS
jgi:hypothetical protein